MRKINAILGPLMIILLVIHGIWGTFQLSGIIPGGSIVRKVLSYIMVAAVVCHIIIGIKLTVDTLIAIKRSGASYFKDNLEFWVRRISGLALILFIIYHMLVFMGKNGEVFRLNSFGGVQLAAHILLVIALTIHLIFNIRPLFIALGITNREYIKDIAIILTVILVVCAVGFFIYYLRWNVFWSYGG